MFQQIKKEKCFRLSAPPTSPPIITVIQFTPGEATDENLAKLHLDWNLMSKKKKLGSVRASTGKHLWFIRLEKEAIKNPWYRKVLVKDQNLSRWFGLIWNLLSVTFVAGKLWFNSWSSSSRHRGPAVQPPSNSYWSKTLKNDFLIKLKMHQNWSWVKQKSLQWFSVSLSGSWKAAAASVLISPGSSR